MFELSIALKYLVPRKRQLSVSIISLISILVIALVVWLVVVFFSVTHGLEKTWIQKLIALTAPVRITPTEAYYHSYYYQSDLFSAASGYSPKSIREKLRTPSSDPYDPALDGELPTEIQAPLRNSDGSVKDLVASVFQAATSLPSVPGLKVRDFELTVTNLQLQLVRYKLAEEQESTLSQNAYLGSFDSDNSALLKAIQPATHDDMRNFMHVLSSVIDSPAQIAEGTASINTKLFTVGSKEISLPSDPILGEGVLLPKSFKASGILLGDRGHLSYYTPTMSSMQEQRLPIYVAGFYDPGILPVGGKFILANPEVISVVRSAHAGDMQPMSNGINVSFDNIEQAESVKKALQDTFKRDGIDAYWQVETYREYEFTKDLLQQLRSERNLWTLLATVIIMVACSNIISMLIILVNDKKMEIGILRAMGASAFSIATIFGFCGMMMGMLGSIIGMVAAYLTLHNLQSLVDLIGRLQGYEMFNPVFYGNTLPSDISLEAISFVIITTTIISLLAGIVPALKAGMLKPAIILKAE
ncbi:MAG: ABC transporter permease [Parachlamydiaceae bacterium]|nr:ABC transporter permease [Parachlamydiaceae bacterium]